MLISIPSSGQSNQYCIPSYSPPSGGIHITHFTFNTIDNVSGENGYTNYPIHTTVLAGEVYSYSITFPGGSGFKYFGIYADFDGDGNFTNANETLVYSTTQSDYESGQVMIPVNIADIDTRMRVVTSDSPIGDVCAHIEHGEVEDYQIMVASKVDEDFVVVLTSRDEESDNYPDCEIVFDFEIHQLQCAQSTWASKPIYLVCYLTALPPAGSNSSPYFIGTGLSTPPQSIINDIHVTVNINQLFPMSMPLTAGNDYVLQVVHNRISLDLDCNPSLTDGYSITFKKEDGCGITVLNRVGTDHDPTWTNNERIMHETTLDQGWSHPTKIKAISESIVDLSVRPNPFSNATQISYKLEKEEKIHLYLVDLQGKKVADIQNLEKQPQGMHTTYLSIDDFPSGMYYLILENSSGRQIEKIVKVD
ncbi:MAG: hypothetical protein DHS20C18_42900 [Saprospiraceae bacterium]|nr:MAG: hypothetical protein DHS20C18_42900 [Saprospiraceae bacterium]